MKSSMGPILWAVVLTIAVLHTSRPLTAEPIRVRHVEGVTFGFLVLRDLDGKAIAHGYLKQVVTPGEPVVLGDLQFHFKDGSIYREITKFTQRGTFRLVSDQVTQKGPSFKQESDSLLDVAKGRVTVKTMDKGKEKTAVKQLAIPADVSNGMLFILAKNMDPSAPETVVSMVALTDKPRVVKLRFTPSAEKHVTFGPYTFKAQHYVMKVKIEGAAGKVAPLIGKQPPDSHFFVVKSESPTFYEFEGPMSADGPVWRMELGAPEPEAGNGKASGTEPSKDASPH